MNPTKPKLKSPEIQAQWFKRVREAHSDETAEDYVELIADLIEVNNEARASDLALRFGISNATVSKVLMRLKEEGYIDSRPYRSLFLTKKGSDLARKSKARHRLIVDFLVTLGVAPDIAEHDAEGLEHHVSTQTLKVFKQFVARQHSAQSHNDP
jgi:DtxR family transcriptional regulator, manganese transport regulator